MPKKPLSVTLDEANLLWLKGRAARGKARSLSHAIDAILTEARLGGRGGDPVRSVVGSIDIAADDPALDQADEAIAPLFAESLARPLLAGEPKRPWGAAPPGPRQRRGRPGHG
jgi:hypothetical protein